MTVGFYSVCALLFVICSAAGCGAGDPNPTGTIGAGGSSGASSPNSAGGSNAVGTTTGGTTTGGGGSSGGGTTTGGDSSTNVGGSNGVAGAGPSTSAARQTAQLLGGSNAAPNGYYEYLPPSYDGSTAAPLLVFWHGIGQDGNGTSDLKNVPALGPPEIIAANNWPDARPFIVLSPQYSAKGGDIAVGSGCPSSVDVDAFFTWAIAHYNVDPKRVYLTGLSCGAIGSWDYLAKKAGSVIAAAVVLSGNPGVPTQTGSAFAVAGCALGGAAIWSFHGDKDDTVPYAPDHDTMDKLIACPSPPRRAAVFTDVAGGSHDIWDPIYDLSAGRGDIYAWMLSNAKP